MVPLRVFASWKRRVNPHLFVWDPTSLCDTVHFCWCTSDSSGGCTFTSWPSCNAQSPAVGLWIRLKQSWGIAAAKNGELKRQDVSATSYPLNEERFSQTMPAPRPPGQISQLRVPIAFASKTLWESLALHEMIPDT